MHGLKIVKVDPNVTEDQFNDPRFQYLLHGYEQYFSDPCSDDYKLMIGLHEAGGHGYFARKAGATKIRFRGPTVHWDHRPPKYDCPAISRGATIWTTSPTYDPLDEIKTYVAGYVVRRELSGSPNDAVAIESDLDGCRDWFNKNIEGDESVFNDAVREAERLVCIDLRSPTTRREIWAEARRFVSEIFPVEAATNQVQDHFL